MTTRPTTSPAMGSASVSGGRQLMAVLVVAVAAFSCVVAACAWASDSTTSHAQSFAKRVDIGGGRMMYIECHGSGSPTVLLISGTPPDFGAVVDRTNSAAQYDFRLALTR